MTWLLEDPLPIIFLGILIEALLLGLLVQTGRRSVIVAMVGVLILFTGLLVVEQLIVTDAESVESTLGVIAHDLKRNDVNLILSHISPSAPEIRARAASRLDQVVIRRAEIKGRPEIRVDELGRDKTAVADFTGLVAGDVRSGIVPDFHALRKFVVHFRKEDGRWKVIDYKVRNPL